jgi:hypothetical protein
MSGYVSLKRHFTEPSDGPACYGTARIISPEDTRIEAKNSRRPRDNVNEYTRGGASYAEKVRDAQIACKPDKCESGALRTYKSALFWYLSERHRHMGRLNEIHGEEGIRASQRIFATGIDREIEEGMRARYRAGLFRLNDTRDDTDRAVMSILIFKGGEGMRPCAKRAIDG